MSRNYLALDLEFMADRELHAAHRSFDPWSNPHALAVKRIRAAAVYEFAFNDDGGLSAGTLAVWSAQDSNEQAVVAQVLEYLARRTDAVVLTYGGVAIDVPVLGLAAMEYGIELPPHFRYAPGPHRQRLHLDLGLMIKGSGKSWSHLSQIALRMGLPVALVSGKAMVPQSNDPDGWHRLKDHVALDTLLLALAWTAWSVSQRTSGVRYEPCAAELIAAFLRRRPNHPLEGHLRRYADSLGVGITADIDEVA